MNRSHLDVSKVEFIVTFIPPCPLFSFQGCKVTSVSAICYQCLELRASQWDNDEMLYIFLIFAAHYMGVSENRGTPKSSILIGFSLINHPFWGTPIFGNTHINW